MTIIFLQKVSCLIKKKYEEALAEFSEFGKIHIVTEDEKLLEEIIPKYRAYAYFSLGQHQVNIFSQHIL